MSPVETQTLYAVQPHMFVLTMLSFKGSQRLEEATVYVPFQRLDNCRLLQACPLCACIPGTG